MPNSATISFRCQCGQRMKARVEHTGRKVACPKCREVLAVPPTRENAGPGLPSVSIKAPAAAPPSLQQPGDKSLLGPVGAAPVPMFQAAPIAPANPILAPGHDPAAPTLPGHGAGTTQNPGGPTYGMAPLPAAHQPSSESAFPGGMPNYGPGGYQANLAQVPAVRTSVPTYRPANSPSNQWLPRVLCFVGGGLLCLMGAGILLIVVLVLFSGAEVRARSLRGLIIPFIMISSGIGLIVKGVQWNDS